MIRAFLLIFVLFFSFRAESEIELTLSKNIVAQGDIFFIDVPISSDKGSLVGNWNGNQIFFSPYPPESPNRQRGFVGVDVAAKPGDYQLTITTTTEAFQAFQASQEIGKVMIKVVDANFPTSKVRVPKRQGKADPELERRIVFEKAKVTEVLSGFSPELLFNGSFGYPVSSATITSSFGVRRILFDGTTSTDSYHRGVDFRAAIGTPIKSSNSGRVAYVGNHVLEGKFVILHHGANLFTSYLHMSELKVKEGQAVKRNELLGYSGESGNTRGPHLHWAAVAGGIRVDPLKLFELTNKR